ncbi:MAG: aldehyde dehydrogenase family protein, partial [Chloroflexota bacterium]
MTTMINGSQLIAGTESREGKHPFSGSNPRTKQPLSQPFFDATHQEIDQALQAARVAFEETRSYPSGRLAKFLDQVAQEIEKLGDQLLQTADEETGLGINRLEGERARTTGQLRKFAALLREGSYAEAIIDTAQPDRQPAPRPSIRRMLFPLGPVAVFSASNFPFAFAVAGGDSASAFAAGCPVIVKGHPSHPATSELFGRAINRAVAGLSFPPGFFSLIQGISIDVGQTLVTHPDLAAIGFTGSLRAGRSLFDAAAARPKPIPVYAEMGSLNPVVLLPGALAERGQAILEGFIHSVTLGSGQFCTNPGLVFLIDGPETEAFASDLAGRMAELQPGVLLNANIEKGLADVVDRT